MNTAEQARRENVLMNTTDKVSLSSSESPSNGKASHNEVRCLRRSELQSLYNQEVADADPRDGDTGRDYVEMYITSFLSETEHARKLRRQLLDVLDASVHALADWDPYRARNAFRTLEMYMLNVYRSPWKRELKSLKTYSGYYQVWVEPYLKDAAMILSLIGYRQRHGRVLESFAKIPADNVRAVACECFIASVECLMLLRIQQKMSYLNYSIKDIYRSRVECSGGVVQCVKWITENCTPLPSVEGATVRMRRRTRVADREKLQSKRQSKSLDDLIKERSQSSGRECSADALRRGDSLDNEKSISDPSEVPPASQPKRRHQPQLSKDWTDTPLAKVVRGKAARSKDPRLLHKGKKVKDSSHRSRGRDRDYSDSSCSPRPSTSSNPSSDRLDVTITAVDGDSSSTNTDVSNEHNSEKAASEEFDLYEAGTLDDHLRESLRCVERLDRASTASSSSYDHTDNGQARRRVLGRRILGGVEDCQAAVVADPVVKPKNPTRDPRTGDVRDGKEPLVNGKHEDSSHHFFHLPKGLTHLSLPRSLFSKHNKAQQQQQQQQQQEQQKQSTGLYENVAKGRLLSPNNCEISDPVIDVQLDVIPSNTNNNEVVAIKEPPAGPRQPNKVSKSYRSPDLTRTANELRDDDRDGPRRSSNMSSSSGGSIIRADSSSLSSTSAPSTRRGSSLSSASASSERSSESQPSPTVKAKSKRTSRSPGRAKHKSQQRRKEDVSIQETVQLHSYQEPRSQQQSTVQPTNPPAREEPRQPIPPQRRRMLGEPTPSPSPARSPTSQPSRSQPQSRRMLGESPNRSSSADSKEKRKKYRLRPCVDTTA